MAASTCTFPMAMCTGVRHGHRSPAPAAWAGLLAPQPPRIWNWKAAPGKRPSRQAVAPVAAALPATRRAYYADKDTPSGKLQVGEIPNLEPAKGEVLIEVAAAGLNGLDWTLAGFIAKIPPFIRQAPYVAGRDVSGTVVAVGEGITGFAVGDDVFGMTGLTDSTFSPASQPKGGYATYTVLKAKDVAKKPASVSHPDAASVPLSALTAWAALEAAKFGAGQKVLVWGGAGGVGTLLIQMAKARGAAEVAVTCGPSSAELCRGLGANVVVDYTKEDFENVIKGYDLVVDAVGYDAKCERAKKVLKEGGKLVDLISIPSIGYLRGYKGDSVIDFSKNVIEFGKDVGYQIVGVAQDGPALRKIAAMMEAGDLKAVIDTTFDGLDQVEAAFDAHRSGHTHGKVVIEMIKK